MPAKRITTYRVIRWTIQLAFLVLFVLLFARTRYGVSPALGDVFFRLDPLVLLVTSIASRAIVAAALLSLIFVAGTIVFGRFFCGFVCPLGTTIDLSDSVIRRKPGPGTRLRNTKYAVLLGLVVAALLGASFIGFFDPLVIMERSLTLVFFPFVSYVAGTFGNARVAVFTETFIAFAALVLILGLGFIAPRFWCRNLCPLGGLFALLAKFSLFKFRFIGECRECGVCQNVCPTGAILSQSTTPDHESPLRIDSGECIDCLACQYRCARGAVSYRVKPRPTPLDIGRRQAIIAIGSGLVLAPLARSLVHQRLQARLIRPPGALPEPDFLAACLRCGRCMKVCPTGALQPAILESGVNGLWTPRVVPRIGGCEKNCNMCGQVCPTGAIRKLSLEEKSFAKIGTAVVDRSRCIAWEQDRVCLICDEACQYNAINSFNETIRGTSLLRPFVDERVCVGCGICESRCPVEGAAAIQAFSIGEERKRSGLYKTDAKVEQRRCGETPPEDVPSGFIQ